MELFEKLASLLPQNKLVIIIYLFFPMAYTYYIIGKLIKGAFHIQKENLEVAARILANAVWSLITMALVTTILVGFLIHTGKLP